MANAIPTSFDLNLNSSINGLDTISKEHAQYCLQCYDPADNRRNSSTKIIT